MHLKKKTTNKQDGNWSIIFDRPAERLECHLSSWHVLHPEEALRITVPDLLAHSVYKVPTIRAFLLIKRAEAEENHSVVSRHVLNNLASLDL